MASPSCIQSKHRAKCASLSTVPTYEDMCTVTAADMAMWKRQCATKCFKSKPPICYGEKPGCMERKRYEKCGNKILY